MADPEPLPPADVVVAADVMYLAKTGEAAARRVVEAYERGSRVIVGDSPDRPGRPAFLATLAELVPDVAGVCFFEQAADDDGPTHEGIVRSVALMDSALWGEQQ